MAIITNNLKQVLADILINDVSATPYYVAVGRAEDWLGSTPTLTDSDGKLREQKTVRSKLHTYKRISNASHAVPRILWSSGNQYAQFDNSVVDAEDASFYVVTSKDEVYVCVQSAKNVDGSLVNSTVEPDVNLHTKAGSRAKTFGTSDGYRWRYLYKISPFADSRFVSTDFIPVKTIDSGASPTISEEIAQQGLQDSAVDGEIIGFRIVDGGAGYTSAPTISIQPTTNTSAAFTATVNGGVVTKVEVDFDAGDSTYSHGSGFGQVKAILSGGSPSSPAVLEPILAPSRGLNYSPVRTLKADHVIVQGSIEDDETGTLLATNDFRQVALIRAPKKYDLITPLTANQAIALPAVVVSSVTGFAEDDVISGATNTARANLFAVSGSNLYYYQTDSTGYQPFSGAAEAVQTVSGSGTGNTTATSPFSVDPEVDVYSGDIIFLENVNAVTRQTAPAQTEDFRFIFKL
jgi:hypothetical protein